MRNFPASHCLIVHVGDPHTTMGGHNRSINRVLSRRLVPGHLQYLGRWSIAGGSSWSLGWAEVCCNTMTFGNSGQSVEDLKLLEVAWNCSKLVEIVANYKDQIHCFCAMLLFKTCQGARHRVQLPDTNSRTHLGANFDFWPGSWQFWFCTNFSWALVLEHCSKVGQQPVLILHNFAKFVFVFFHR